MIDMPQCPREPDYEKIIREELSKIGAHSKRITFFKNNSAILKNPAYNDALVESFVTTTFARINQEKLQYLQDMEKYETELTEYKKLLEKQKKENDILIAQELVDFNSVKTFYENFRTLSKAKFKFISDMAEKLLDNK